MRTPTLIAAAAVSAVMAGSSVAGAAQAAPAIDVRAAPFSAVYVPGGQPLLVKAQYVYLGHNYCWYDNAWRGPGYYWCGYGGRSGYGWGGGYGWRGWGGGHRGGYYHGAGFAVSRGHYDHGGHFSRGDHGYHGGGGHGGHGGGEHGGGDHHH